MQLGYLSLLLLASGSLFVALVDIANIQDRILFATFFAVVVYTGATYRLVQEARNQNSLQLAPFLTIGWKKDRAQDALYIKNMGKGVAVDVQIKRVPKSIAVGSYRTDVCIDGVASIMPEDNAGVTVPYSQSTKVIADDEQADLPPPLIQDKDQMNPSTCTYQLVISYKDIAGREYKTIAKADRSSNQMFSLLRYESLLFKTDFSE